MSAPCPGLNAKGCWVNPLKSSAALLDSRNKAAMSCAIINWQRSGESVCPTAM